MPTSYCLEFMTNLMPKLYIHDILWTSSSLMNYISFKDEQIPLGKVNQVLCSLIFYEIQKNN